MSGPAGPVRPANRWWISEDDPSLDDFRALVGQRTDLADYPYAASVTENVLIYSAAGLLAAGADPVSRRAVQGEIMRALMLGPGIMVVERAFDDEGVVDQASEVFLALIQEQHDSGSAAGDHFGVPGANDRVWNALQKLAIRAPEVFARYYSNDMIAMVCEAWLGPYYQVTSTVNVVNPGGAAQSPHRDYHLGFQPQQVAVRYPAHVHRAVPWLTLQCAVAHNQMPLESGPTMYLPYSQTYEPGYLSWRLPQFREYFQDHRVQLPLRKGDMVFFNPALFHAAGQNRTIDVKRIANLLQVSSAFGRAMESVDRRAMCLAVFPALVAMHSAGASERHLLNAVAACAEGYAFPTNLDRDQPTADLVPDTQAIILWRAVVQDWPADQLASELVMLAKRTDPSSVPDEPSEAM